MEIKFIHLGNGIVVYTPDFIDPYTKEFLRIAHINVDREIKFHTLDSMFDGKVAFTDTVKNAIVHYAKFENPRVSDTDNRYVFNSFYKQTRQYLITGVDKQGKRFCIRTTTPQHYNIWRGTLWDVTNGIRKKIRSYEN